MKKNKLPENNQIKTEPTIVGNDSDEHGCKASAGYTWSVIKNDCIRTWETGIQLEPIENQSFKATVVLSDDLKKAELFIVNVVGSVMLDQVNPEKEVYSSEAGYEFSKQENGWLLKKDNKSIYKN
ncbi:hypothetical protein [Emticicia aquatica]|nr:hypothetical protein [Emticicia aquatica]